MSYTAPTSPFCSQRFQDYCQNDVVQEIARGYDGAAEIYDGRNHWETFWELNEQPRILAYCHQYLHHPDWALDIGCGTGTLVKVLRNQGIQTYGIDPSQAMLDKAAEKNQSQEGLFIGDATSLPFKDSSLNLAVSARVFAHVSDLNRTFDEIARVLKSGGILIFTDIYHRIKPTRIRKGNVEFNIPTYLRSYDEVMDRVEQVKGLRLIESKILSREQYIIPTGDEFFFRFLDNLTQPAYSYLIVMRRD